MPLVSIIIPNFNHGRYLGERFRSISEQCFQDFEVIFLDDGSTDGSSEFADSVRLDQPLRIRKNRRNSGSVFDQWRRGLDEARGQYVWIAESDDTSQPNFLNVMTAALDRHPSAALGYCQSTLVDARGSLVSAYPSYLDDIDPLRWKRSYSCAGRDELEHAMILRNSIPNASACIFRREALGAALSNRVPLRLCGDWLVYSRMLQRAGLVFVSEPMNIYRVHSKSLRSVVDNGFDRIAEGYLVQDSISRTVRLRAETHELACRFSLRELTFLAARLDRNPLNDALLKCAARQFDPALVERLADWERQRLPCARVAQRSWRTMGRRRESFRVYRDDRPVVLEFRVRPGTMEVDLLGKSGSVEVIDLQWADRSGRPLADPVTGDRLAALIFIGADSALQIKRSEVSTTIVEGTGGLVITTPKAVAGGDLLLKIAVRAAPPPSLL